MENTVKSTVNNKGTMTVESKENRKYSIIIQKELQIITPIVKQIQAGNSDKWLDLLEELSKHKETTVAMYSSKFSKYVSKEDVVAMYDDTLMESVETFDSDLTDNFVKYFYNAVKVRMNNLKTHATRRKRVANIEAVYGDSSLGDSEGDSSFTLFDTVESPEEYYSEVETAVSLQKLLSEYSEQSDKTKLNTELIVAAALTDEGTEERKTMILNLLPEGTTWASARQKLSRARADLKGYIVAESFEI